MFPSPLSTSTLKGLGIVRADGLVENSSALSTFLTRSRFSVAERIQKRINRLHGRAENDSPSKGKHPGRGSPSTSKFGRDRMVQARSGRVRRPSLEAACLSAQGGDAFQVPPLSEQPGNSSVSWEACPSLVCSSAEHINLNSSGIVNLGSTPSGTTSPLIKAHGYEDRRSASHYFVHETIDKEMTKIKTLVSAITSLQADLPDVSLQVNNSPKRLFQEYYTMKAEAETILVESQKQWTDTPYSASIVQDFRPPYDVEMMQSLLQESLKNYKPLPSELRHRQRSNTRISCRMSPYANSRPSKLISSHEIAASPSPSKRKHNMVIPNKETSSVLDEFTNRNRPTLAARPLAPYDIVDKASAHEEAPKYASPLKAKSILRPPLITKLSVPTGSPLTNKLATHQTPVTKRANNKENLCREPPKTPGGPLKVDRPRPRYRTPTPGRMQRPAKERQNVNLKDS